MRSGGLAGICQMDVLPIEVWQETVHLLTAVNASRMWAAEPGD